ncbi:MAG: efflux RND transporter periplasmic adaptor subunit [Burkholderiales bacterium]|nr:efflux RND transporter periplasmic adaptor subunit [Burkholderiales bacterium]
MTRKKNIILLLILFIIIGIAGFSYRFWQRHNEHDNILTLYGNVDLREVQLAFMVQERIVELNAHEGDHVKQGQLLGKLDPTRFESIVQEFEARMEHARQQLNELEKGSRPQEILKAKADVDAAKASLNDAEQHYRRVEKLVQENFLSPQNMDDARRQLDVAQARLKAENEVLSLTQEGPRNEVIAAARASLAQTEAQLKHARKDLQDTWLFSPADGTIRSRILEPGDIATPGKPVYTLAKLEPVWIRTYIPETELGHVTSGMQAQILTDSYPDIRYTGWVGYISPTAEFTPKNVETPALRTQLVYQIWVYACNTDNSLRLGMPVTVELKNDTAQIGAVAHDCSRMQ